MDAIARRRVLRTVIAIWCALVLLTVAMTVVEMSGVVLAMLWVTTWLTSSAGLCLIVLADDQDS